MEIQRPGGEVLIGSTDVGDVTWKVPTTEVLIATAAIGTPLHSWQMTAQGQSGAAHKGMVHAAKAMGLTAQILLSDPARLAAAQAEHTAKLARNPYISPIPWAAPAVGGAGPRNWTDLSTTGSRGAEPLCHCDPMRRCRCCECLCCAVPLRRTCCLDRPDR